MAPNTAWIPVSWPSPVVPPEAAVPQAELETVLREAGANLGPMRPMVRYAKLCPFRGEMVAHFVVQGASGPVTVLLLPDEEVERPLPVDEDGFIQEPELWDEDVARALAKTEGVDELTDTHWRLVNYLREYYLEYNMAPMIRKLCKQTGFSLKEVYDLFPSGPAKGACKVAGLPKPTGCV